MENYVIEVKDVVKRYKELTALDHFSLNVKQGEVLGLLGPNGSGKSTAINCMVALLKYDSGTIKLFGKAMGMKAYDIKKDIGLVMQDIGVIEELNVYDNIDYFCGLYVSNKKLRKQYVQEAIDFVELNEYKKFLPKKLSGGLLRRLNIACGIAHKPKLIFLDEPTVAVDPQSRNKILEQIKALNEAGSTIIYTSHYMEEVEYLCNRIVIMDKGRMLAQGSKEQLKEMITTNEVITFEVSEAPQVVVDALTSMAGVVSVSYKDSILEVRMSKGDNNIVRILEVLKREQVTYSKMQTQMPSLNDVFLEITGKALRDE